MIGWIDKIYMLFIPKLYYYVNLCYTWLWTVVWTYR